MTDKFESWFVDWNERSSIGTSSPHFNFSIKNVGWYSVDVVIEASEVEIADVDVEGEIEVEIRGDWNWI